MLTAALAWSWSLYLVGWWLTPFVSRYFWVTYDVSDYNAHLRWARQAWEGKTGFVNLFTTEQHQPRTFNLHDWLVGRVARWLGISLHFSMRLVHTVGVVVFVLAAWWLSLPFLTDEQQRTYLLMLCFLGGFIWLAMPEANTYMALATMSWFVWGKALTALLAGSFVRLCCSEGANGKKFAFGIAALGVAAGMLVGNIHPYALAPLGYALVLWVAAQWRLKQLLNNHSLLRSLLVTVLLFAPAFATALWQAWAILSDPIYRAEFLLPLETPPLWAFALNYGIFLALAIVGAVFVVRQRPVSRAALFLVAWLVGGFLAVYLTPTAQPRKLIEGAHLPMCVLAAWAWHTLVLPRTVAIRRHPFLVLLLVGGITPLSFWVSQVGNFLQNDEIALHYGGVPFYLRDEHVRLIEWLSLHTLPSDAILCNYQLGNYIPVLTGRRVFIGHWGGTVRVSEKMRLAQQIWRGEMPLDKAQALFRQHNLHYAIATVYERHATKPRHRPEECQQVRERFHLDKYGVPVFRIGNNVVYRLMLTGTPKKQPASPSAQPDTIGTKNAKRLEEQR